MKLPKFDFLKSVFSKKAVVKDESKPSTLKSVIDDLLKQIKEEEFRKIIKQHPDGDSFTAMYHHGFGTNLRNDLNLWSEESADLKQDIWNDMSDAEKKLFNDHWKKCGSCYQGSNMHADDASAILMERLWDAAKDKYKYKYK